MKIFQLALCSPLQYLQYLLVGPALGSLFVLLLPSFLAGQLMWMALSFLSAGNRQDFTQIDFEGDESNKDDKVWY
jgi:hypothetical protein